MCVKYIKTKAKYHHNMEPSKIYINNPQIETVTCATITGYIN